MTVTSLDRTVDIARKIETRQARVGIVGMGYVGLPLALLFSDARFRVTGFDIDPGKVDTLNRADSYIVRIPATEIKLARERGFTATADYAQIAAMDVIIICVPTPLDEHHEPDLRYIRGTFCSIAPHVHDGQLIILESTTYPGTTEEVVVPLLEKGNPEGLCVARDSASPGFYVAFSPEREDPGNDSIARHDIPKVVGGCGSAARDLASAVYSTIFSRIVPVSSPAIAEMTKLLENIYRCVNIALVNELKQLCIRMNIDLIEVIEAAKTKPFGFQAFYPGPGLGGHCIPIDPFYLTWVARQHGLSTRFIELAGEVNTSMPAYVIGRVTDALNERSKPVKGSRVAILGMAYKKDVDDPRESPGFELMDLLRERGAVVSYNDPHIPELPRMRHWPHLAMTSSPLTEEYLAAQDCILIA